MIHTLPILLFLNAGHPQVLIEVNQFRLFGEGTIPAAFTLTDSLVTPNGVIFANYKRAGEVKTGTIGS